MMRFHIPIRRPWLTLVILMILLTACESTRTLTLRPDGHLELNGKPTTQATLSHQLRGKEVIIRADESIPFSEVTRLRKSVADAGAKTIKLTTFRSNEMPATPLHKEVAKFLKQQTGGSASVHAYRDDAGERPIPIGTFGDASPRLHSTLGAFDLGLSLPQGTYEFAACGPQEWLPNALVSSIYWLTERRFQEWPVVCEDVLRPYANGRYRHMAFAPSPFTLALSDGSRIQWLLGIPISDSDIGIDATEILGRAANAYPAWILKAAD